MLSRCIEKEKKPENRVNKSSNTSPRRCFSTGKASAPYLHHLILTSAIHETHTSPDPRTKSKFSLKCPGKGCPVFGELPLFSPFTAGSLCRSGYVIFAGVGIHALHCHDGWSLRLGWRGGEIVEQLYKNRLLWITWF